MAEPGIELGIQQNFIIARNKLKNKTDYIECKEQDHDKTLGESYKRPE